MLTLDIHVQKLYLLSVAVLSARQAVELFHLVFLAAFVAQDKERVAVKGGCNLRFFLGSIRYSEDIDLDTEIAKGTLKNKVDRLLQSPVIRAPLKRHGIEIAESSAPKQTDTTQRWKATLELRALRMKQPTRIEFSRRTMMRPAFEAVDRAIVQPYGVPPFVAPHYPAAMAIAQKIEALATRSEPQARDVFDLNLLFARPECGSVALPRALETARARAVENAMSISYDDYRAHVVAYLHPDHADAYASRSVWDGIQTNVVDRLREGS
jgi:predicted nucleotidyltransferase component of viral defense system